MFYIARITGDHINHELQKNITSILSVDNIKKIDSNNYIKDILSLIKPEYYSVISQKLKNKEDDTKILINSKIVSQIIIVIVFLVIIILLINFIPRLLSFNTGIKGILLELLIVFGLIIVLEIYFFNNVASKYIPVEPSFMNNYILQKIVKNL